MVRKLEPIYTTNEAAEYLKLHPKTVARFIREGTLKAFKMDRRWRLKESTLRAFVADAEKRAGSPKTTARKKGGGRQKQ